MSFFPSQPRVYARPPLTDTAECPLPTFARQSTFGSASSGHPASTPFSFDTPSRSGPRHSGQSSAGATEANARAATAARSPWFVMVCPRFTTAVFRVE